MKKFLVLLLLAGCAVDPEAQRQAAERQQQKQRAYVDQLVSQCRTLGFRDEAIPQCALQLHQQRLQAKAQQDAAFNALAGSLGMGLLNQSGPRVPPAPAPSSDFRCSTFNGQTVCRSF